jgi:hypothetical protein
MPESPHNDNQTKPFECIFDEESEYENQFCSNFNGFCCGPLANHF